MLGLWMRNVVANSICTAMEGLSLLETVTHLTPIVASPYPGIINAPGSSGFLSGFFSKILKSQRAG